MSKTTVSQIFCAGVLSSIAAVSCCKISESLYCSRNNGHFTDMTYFTWLSLASGFTVRYTTEHTEASWVLYYDATGVWRITSWPMISVEWNLSSSVKCFCSGWQHVQPAVKPTLLSSVFLRASPDIRHGGISYSCFRAFFFPWWCNHKQIVFSCCKLAAVLRYTVCNTSWI